jgi:hypothetical protein
MNRKIIVNNCWNCPYNRQGSYCRNDETLNMDIEEYATGAKNKIHPKCKLLQDCINLKKKTTIKNMRGM